MHFQIDKFGWPLFHIVWVIKEKNETKKLEFFLKEHLKEGHIEKTSDHEITPNAFQKSTW